MKLDGFKNIYFLGIGGIGMSALARWFKAKGYWVGGYDKTPTALTHSLEKEGIDIHYAAQEGRIPTPAYQKHHTLVIYTPAIPKDHVELQYFQAEHFTLLKRAQVLGLIAAQGKCIAIAGTHGKTTTSSMVAHILTSAGVHPSAFVGGIMANYQSNLLIGSSDWVVVEADEFDRSFLHLHPDMAVVTSTDADHLDIYGNHQALKQSFQHFVNQIKPQGLLVKKYGLDLASPVPTIEYGHAEATVWAENIEVDKGCFVFDYCAALHRIENIVLPLPGYHNVENALAAITIALHLGLKDDAIKWALATYKGVKRRFEKIIDTEDLVLIDDYAHHPEEIQAFLRSVKKVYPDKKITCVFQPHLYSRTQDFAPQFAKALSEADQVYLLDIYPAREKPIPGITAQTIGKDITVPLVMCTMSDCIETLLKANHEVICMVGAGDIDTLVQPLAEALLKITETTHKKPYTTDD